MFARLLSFFLLNLFLIFPLFAGEKKLKWDLSIVAIFQNDARYLKEWIEFHKLIGVEHFWLYNNCSTDNYAEVLEPYRAAGIVELINWPRKSNGLVHWNRIQCEAYMDAVSRAKSFSNWLAIIDTDEFLFSPKTDSVPEILKGYKKAGAVGVNWLGFGTSHVKQLYTGRPMVEQLIYRGKLDDTWHRHVKCVVNPRRVASVVSPHFPGLMLGYNMVTTQKTIFHGPYSPVIDYSILRLNHYWTRDEEYLNSTKLYRGDSWGHDLDRIIKRAEKLNLEYDDAIQRFLPQLKAAMNYP